MNVLILGGSRFMGLHVSTQLLERGDSVSVLNRGSAAAVDGVEVLSGDRAEPDGLASVEGREFDAVVDLSGYQSAWVVASADSLAGRIGQYVFISSGSVYQPSTMFPWPESNAVGPDPAWGAYAIGKAESEAHLQDHAARGSFSCSILRLPYAMGAANYADRESFVFSRLGAGQPILLPGGGNAINQYVHARDVAAAVLACLAKPVSGARTYNVGLPSAITNRGFVHMCAQIAGTRAEIIDIPSGRNGDTAEIVNLTDVIYPIPNENYFLDPSLIAEELGVVASVPLEAILREYFDWWSTSADQSPRQYPREQAELAALGR